MAWYPAPRGKSNSEEVAVCWRGGHYGSPTAVGGLADTVRFRPCSRWSGAIARAFRRCRTRRDRGLAGPFRGAQSRALPQRERQGTGDDERADPANMEGGAGRGHGWLRQSAHGAGDGAGRQARGVAGIKRYGLRSRRAGGTAGLRLSAAAMGGRHDGVTGRLSFHAL
jgi:hypothetical protein